VLAMALSHLIDATASSLELSGPWIEWIGIAKHKQVRAGFPL
jgi:hypothetical protein